MKTLASWKVHTCVCVRMCVCVKCQIRILHKRFPNQNFELSCCLTLKHFHIKYNHVQILISCDVCVDMNQDCYLQLVFCKNKYM